MKGKLSIKSKRQAIYLTSSPLSERDFNRFGIKNWLESGWQVKVYDVTNFLYPEYWHNVCGDEISINFQGLRIIKNLREIIDLLNDIDGYVVFIDLLKFSRTEQKIRNAAQIHGPLVKIKLGSIPKVELKRDIFRYFLLIKKPIQFFKKLKFYIIKRLETSRALKYVPDYLVVGGKKSLSKVNFKKTSVIRAHNLDYDFFIQKKNNTKKTFSLVFLDEYGPYHPDFNRLNVKPYMTADNYYPIIDFGLSKIAKSLNLNVKIAAHPKSDYKNQSLKYKHPIFENKTFELINEADLIVTLGSTSLQWAVILKKPIIFVTTNEIQNSFNAKSYSKFIHYFAQILGKRVLNLSNVSKVNDFKEYLTIDEEKYKNYIENYIKMKGSPKKPIWTIVIDHIENDLFHKRLNFNHK
jgi:hypothetical protein